MSMRRIAAVMVLAAGLVLFGGAPPAQAQCTGDLDGDGDVDLSDLAALLANYGTHCVPDGMVSVPEGWFEMGDSFDEGADDEAPVHTVWISRFYIDKYEVTNAQYAQFLNAGGNDDHWISDQKILRQGASPPYVYLPVENYDSHPVVYVSHDDATAFCEWRTIAEGMPPGFYHLPTEAEWEKAAGWDPVLQQHFRFGEHTDGCGYNCLDGQRANYWLSGDPFDNETTPVGYYDGADHGGYQTQDARSYYGCYDMCGNVYEWCTDWYSSSYYSSSPSSNPTGPDSGTYRILRGGAWNTYQSSCRSAYRRKDLPGYRGSTYGFRCAAGTP